MVKSKHSIHQLKFNRLLDNIDIISDERFNNILRELQGMNPNLQLRIIHRVCMHVYYQFNHNVFFYI